MNKIDNIERMLQRMKNMLMGRVNLFCNPSIAQKPTQSPKTPESEDFPSHEIPQTHHEILQMPQIHFLGSQCYTNFLEKDYQRIKKELPKYDGKDHRGDIVWVNKMEAIF